jgi:erythromycin esterase-like protein
MPKILCLLILCSLSCYAQDSSVDWVNKNAYQLNSDTISDNKDLTFLSKELKNKSIIGLGEASHGTQEFYYQKKRIIQYLTSKERYKIIGFECPQINIEPINQYLQNGSGDLSGMLKPMGLYNTDEMYKLFEWLMVFNKSKSSIDKVKLVGFDSSEYWGNPLKRDQLMAENFTKIHKIENLKSILWSHNLHLAKDTTMANYKAMGWHLKQEFGNQFYAIGFDTFKGNVSTINNGEFQKHDFVGKEGTFSSLFAKAKFKTFFLDFHKAPNPLSNTVNSITNLYSNWQEPKPLPIIPGSDFDAIIFIRETTASRAIK